MISGCKKGYKERKNIFRERFQDQTAESIQEQIASFRIFKERFQDQTAENIQEQIVSLECRRGDLWRKSFFAGSI